MSSNEANELKIIVETLCQMIDMFFVLGKECLCNQCVVTADDLRLPLCTEHFCSSKTFSDYLSFTASHKVRT